MALSIKLKKISQGYPFHQKDLKAALNHPLITDEDRNIINYFLNGINAYTYRENLNKIADKIKNNESF